MSQKIGVDCKMYLMTGGTDESPTLTLVNRIGDVTSNHEGTAVESSTRASAYMLYEKGMFDGGVDFDMKSDFSDPVFVAIRDAHLARGEAGKLRFQILDDVSTTTEAEGLDAYFIVTKFTRNEPLNDRVTHSVELKLTEKDGFYPSFISAVAEA